MAGIVAFSDTNNKGPWHLRKRIDYLFAQFLTLVYPGYNRFGISDWRLDGIGLHYGVKFIRF